MSHQCDSRYECVHFDTADKLLQAIAPVPALDTGTPNPKFIFRGQRCADWDLTPTALRKDRNQPNKSCAVTHLSTYQFEGSGVDQVFAEFHLLKAFMEICDRSGISLPEDGYEVRRELMNDQRGIVEAAYRDPSKWPQSKHLPLLAFAQHHGIPTRLLDWTSNATVGAYFAAAGHANSEEQYDLAVWALNIELIHIYETITMVPMPGSNSPRLSAQGGLFTLTRLDTRRGVSLDLDSVSLADALVSPNEPSSRPKPLWKLTLPHSEALRLLYLCHINGVDAASVYPDAAGAAIATLERAAWGRADPQTGRNAVSARELGIPKVKSHRVI